MIRAEDNGWCIKFPTASWVETQARFRISASFYSNPIGNNRCQFVMCQRIHDEVSIRHAIEDCTRRDSGADSTQYYHHT